MTLIAQRGRGGVTGLLSGIIDYRLLLDTFSFSAFLFKDQLLLFRQLFFFHQTDFLHVMRYHITDLGDDGGHEPATGLKVSTLRIENRL